MTGENALVLNPLLFWLEGAQAHISVGTMINYMTGLEVEYIALCDLHEDIECFLDETYQDETDALGDYEYEYC